MGAINYNQPISYITQLNLLKLQRAATALNHMPKKVTHNLFSNLLFTQTFA